MKHTILTLLISLFAFPIFVSAQEPNTKHYIYNIFELRGGKTQTVYIDNGLTVEELQDAEGKRIKFKTVAGTLMYLLSQGWELYMPQDKISGASYNGIGATETTVRWIMRKPVSKEELDGILKDVIKE